MKLHYEAATETLVSRAKLQRRTIERLYADGVLTRRTARKVFRAGPGEGRNNMTAITGGGFETATKAAHAERPIRPYGARVLVVPDLEATKTKGGIWKPDAARECERKGKVIAVGPGTLKKDGSLRPIDVQVGEVVLFNEIAGKYAGTAVVLEDGTKALMVLEDDIIGVVE